MLHELSEAIRAEFPKFKVVRKDQSRLMAAVDLALRIVTLGKMASFMTSFVTTIGQTVYVPSDWASTSEVSRCIVLRHERVHMRQSRRYGRLLYSVGYLMFPLPMGLAWFRARLEMEAYAESVAALVEYRGTSTALSPGYQEAMVRHFTSAEYAWMWPFPGTVRKWVKGAVDEAVAKYVGRG